MRLREKGSQICNARNRRDDTEVVGISAAVVKWQAVATHATTEHRGCGWKWRANIKGCGSRTSVESEDTSLIVPSTSDMVCAEKVAEKNGIQRWTQKKKEGKKKGCV